MGTDGTLDRKEYDRIDKAHGIDNSKDQWDRAPGQDKIGQNASHQGTPDGQ